MWYLNCKFTVHAGSQQINAYMLCGKRSSQHCMVLLYEIVYDHLKKLRALFSTHKLCLLTESASITLYVIMQLLDEVNTATLSFRIYKNSNFIIDPLANRGLTAISDAIIITNNTDYFLLQDSVPGLA